MDKCPKLDSIASEAAASLLDFPNELLCLIIDNLASPCDLTCMGRTCKRLAVLTGTLLLQPEEPPAKRFYAEFWQKRCALAFAADCRDFCAAQADLLVIPHLLKEKHYHVMSWRVVYWHCWIWTHFDTPYIGPRGAWSTAQPAWLHAKFPVDFEQEKEVISHARFDYEEVCLRCIVYAGGSFQELQRLYAAELEKKRKLLVHAAAIILRRAELLHDILEQMRVHTMVWPKIGTCPLAKLQNIVEFTRLAVQDQLACGVVDAGSFFETVAVQLARAPGSYDYGGQYIDWIALGKIRCEHAILSVHTLEQLQQGARAEWHLKLRMLAMGFWHSMGKIAPSGLPLTLLENVDPARLRQDIEEDMQREQARKQQCM